jgi:hypothetical protein
LSGGDGGDMVHSRPVINMPRGTHAPQPIMSLSPARWIKRVGHNAARRMPDIDQARLPSLFAPQVRTAERALRNALEPEDVRVCLCYGPYRNLTTLTAALLGLHEEVAVLNHAALRVFPEASVNFLRDGSLEKRRRFVSYAVFLSERGRRGDLGGSIVHSHAFESPAFREIYEERFPNGKTPQRVRAVFWKDPNRITNYAANHGIGLPALLAADPNVRVLLPIRNPVHCARSLQRTGHDRFLVKGRPPRFSAVLEAVVRSVAAFQDLAETFPDRCFQFIEDEIDVNLLRRLETFLALSGDPHWAEIAARLGAVRGTARVTPDEADLCRSLIDRHLANAPATASGLLRLLETHP